MNFLVRPSKSFEFDQLEKMLRKITKGTGLDAGSAGFKNRHMFKTERYLGLDYNLPALEKYLGKDKSTNTFGLYANLLEIGELPDGSMEVVVSTNTLYCLADDARIKVVESLCRLTSPSGCLIFDTLISQDIDQLVNVCKEYFEQIKIIYYRNPISRFYESIFEKDGYLGSHSLAGTKLFRIFAWLLGRLEYLTYKFRKVNQFAIIVCRQKKNQAENSLDLSKFKSISDKLYSLINN